MPKREDRPIELLLWGATGFTGRLAAEWLAARYADARVALGGRSAEKLEALRDTLIAIDARCAAWPIRVADALDVPALDRIVPEAAVVATTAGPFSKYGHELVAACARHGTDYCDITGEVPFARALLDRNQERARDSGARLVPFCGFDSIPSDLGVFVLQEFARRELGATCDEATFVLIRARGGFSGGTAASAIAISEAASNDARVREMLHDPYALAPDDHGSGATDASGATKIDGAWTAPFAMGTINSRVVHRSNALLDFPYGRDFRYEERVVLGKGSRAFVRAEAMSVGLALGERILGFGAARALAKRFLPAPGEGPSKERRETGSFHVRILGKNAGKVVAVCNISGQGDPGYTGAAKMLVESAFCLSRDVKSDGGMVTPASCMGDGLTARLRAAGIAFDASRA
ncbi:MAG TPA: saccharopine dehydrogenase NADP-binding domain-containing protein [Polyangiaceae bacterium]|jgi:short subunit dehydrogenase-like uncharacterized protein